MLLLLFVGLCLGFSYFRMGVKDVTRVVLSFQVKKSDACFCPHVESIIPVPSLPPSSNPHQLHLRGSGNAE